MNVASPLALEDCEDVDDTDTVLAVLDADFTVLFELNLLATCTARYTREYTML
jgi:hypothetical protein